MACSCLEELALGYDGLMYARPKEETTINSS